MVSYLRGSRFSSEPSPNQLPGGTPIKVMALPEAEKLFIFTMPLMMPIQFSTGSPLRQTKPPFGTKVSNSSASTRANCAASSSWAQLAARRTSLRLESAVIIVRRTIEKWANVPEKTTRYSNASYYHYTNVTHIKTQSGPQRWAARDWQPETLVQTTRTA